jgi:hypothetical protein
MEADLDDPVQIKSLQLIISGLRKIGDDILLEAEYDQFSLRALNSTRSALPVVNFKREFFRNYAYTAKGCSITSQIPAQALITAFKLVMQPTSLTMSIHDSSIFNLGLIDRYGIRHEWELCLGETSVVRASYDLDTAAAQVQCRFDVFTGLSDAFHGHQSVTLEMAKSDPLGDMTFRTGIGDQLGLSSLFSIRRSDYFETQISEEIDRLSVTFTLADFIVAIRIAKVLNQRLTLYITGPGHPIVVKAVLAGQIHFEMAIATSADADSDDDEDAQPEVATGSSSLPEPAPTGTQSSQVSPWPGDRPMKSELADSDRPSENSRVSQLIRQGRFSESPPFALRKRNAGQFAEGSQPSSDESESD